MTDPSAVTPRGDDLETPQEAAPLPGAHRGGYRRELTAPVPVTVPVHTDIHDDAQWAPSSPPPLPRAAGWALLCAVVALAVSLVVGWGIPLGVAGLVLAIIALRRPWEARGVAVWALCLSALSLVYSAGWLWWAWSQRDLFV
ncbi:hypothetical protein [Microbacterium sp.]|uniref:hypothetical protein n=1 Tax=Microbacterium sp. TaxID=51671 RepID=UPI003A849958